MSELITTTQDAEPMEVLILGHQHTAVFDCELPDPLVGRATAAEQPDVL